MGNLEEVTGRVFDLLVVGGGINGAGIARDAAMRGLSVCLVEKEDYGWGTSAKSSMLAHGGLRYLEQFELGLVHEALQEREHLMGQAPHLVHPLKFLYPIYPDTAKRRTVRVGLLLYDLLSHGKSVPKRDFVSRQECLELVPGLDPTDLRGGATYYDGQFTHVERLVLELILDARAHGAVCLNHTDVTRLVVEDGPKSRRCTGARIRTADEETGIVRARATINAAGPWVDDVLGPLNRGLPAKIRKTKGIHIVVPRFTDTALIVRATDGRTFFVLPWKEHCLVGTTDTDYQGDPGDAQATREEVEYLQASARRYLPEAPLDDVQWTTAGVRPLVNQEGLTESHVTRRHVLYDHDKKEGIARLWSVQGGKLTTYRSLSEEAVRQVCKTLGRDREAKMHPTRDATLPGGPLVPWDDFRERAIQSVQDEFHLPPSTARHIVETYGACWRRLVESAPDQLGRIDKRVPHIWAELVWAVQEEQAMDLADLLLRRTDIGLIEPDVAKKVARQIGKRSGREDLDWDVAPFRAQRRLLDVPPATATTKR